MPNTPSSAFSETQQMLALCYISYFHYAATATDRENARKISHEIDDEIAKSAVVQGQWERVWGPALFALPGSKFDDALVYVVKHRVQENHFAIVVRGTNPISLPNWVLWNFQAKDLKLWPGYTEKKDKNGKNNPILSPSCSKITQLQEDQLPCISESSFFGLLVMQALRPPIGILGCNSNLLEFFREQQESLKPGSEPLSIIATGHSLGGALSPLIALWLKEENIPAKFQSITFASPTQGNKTFVEYFHYQIQREDCIRVANDLDIVTLAWDPALMSNILNVYLKQCPPLYPLPHSWLLLRRLQSRSEKKTYRHLADRSAVFPGVFCPTKVPYLYQAIYQHVMAYPKLLDIDDHINWDSWNPFFKLIGQEIRLMAYRMIT
ncbi:hypothetical protein DXV75_01485 [Alteromonas aestuariivivens]|uniref:Fungal lipase-type domain-containing protein n=1 Tax=Alteromonas aestuariivivens TaxID=1938339 RepID=A0A3D8MEI6_9ALTE|nr:hypothetical protein [Alteromonas aestuariivivens]RDV29162.1 hypothetical protein DXV75_01485 [Alteromonas aestuariivivens]